MFDFVFTVTVSVQSESCPSTLYCQCAITWACGEDCLKRFRNCGKICQDTIQPYDEHGRTNTVELVY